MKQGARRPQVIAGLSIIGIVNGVAGTVVSSVVEQGFWAALSGTFGVSTVVLIASCVATDLALRAPDGRIGRVDRVTFALYLAALCIPRSAASMAALTGLAAYEALRPQRSTESVASASLLVCIATCQTWGLILMQLFAPLILSLDAHLAAFALNLVQGGAASVGNLVETAAGQPLIVLTGCSSLSQVSYALTCWLALLRFCRPGARASDVGVGLALFLAVVVVNVSRVGLMGMSRKAYLLIHGPVGAYVTTALILAASIAAAWIALALAPAPARRAPV